MRSERSSLQPARQPDAQSSGSQEDRVEFSESAANYDPQAASEAAMQEKIQTIRSQIADGTYLTPDKLDAAIDRMLDELLGG